MAVGLDVRAGGVDSVRRARRVDRMLAREYPDARCALNFENPFELLVATVLSALCTVVKVNLVSPELFGSFPGPEALAAADPSAVEEIIKPLGLFRNKARSIVGAAREICDKFGGRVPDRMDDLVTLPRVGRKTANVVLGNAFGVPGIAVDTHVARVSRRLGWTQAREPDRIEVDLMGLFPSSRWVGLTHRLIAHGRSCCRARNPGCGECVVASLCPSVGNPSVGNR
ncbi:MAG: endonuclease III [Candidatus Nanopelagicales bacterium]|nr:endonuclease III [Candidatus Nanopelagicales bacterium]